MMDSKEMQDLLERSLSGDQAALCELVDKLTPVIQKRVARALLSYRQGASRGRDIHQEVADLTHDVYVYLFSKNSRVLRTWNPELGLSLQNFVGMAGEKHVRGILRSRKRSPWTDEPTPDDGLDQTAHGHDPEEAAIIKETLRLLLDGLKEGLSPEGWQMFDLLFVQDLTPEEVARRTGKSLAAVYKWRSRLRELVRQLVDMSNSDR